ncbi:MAG: hypothetical protein KGL39_12640 [Patescibacteria group bacterium]|nr:hypothetical protein [Patescibacteria group bacterium]
MPGPTFPGKSIGNEGIPSAQVTIRKLGPDDTLGVINDIQSSSIEVWTDYHIHNRYEKDKHVYMLPITSPGGFAGQSCAFVQLAAPTLLWIADWTAARMASSPIIPSPSELKDLVVTLSSGGVGGANVGGAGGGGTSGTPTDLGEGWVLLDEHYELANLTVGPDGQTPLYRVTGTYVYGQTTPSSFTANDMIFPVPPYMEVRFSRHIDKNSYKQGIIFD